MSKVVVFLGVQVYLERLSSSDELRLGLLLRDDISSAEEWMREA